MGATGSQNVKQDFHAGYRLTMEVMPLFSEVAMVITSIYLPLYSYRLGADEFVVGSIGAAQSITYIFIPFFAGLLSSRLGQRKMLCIGFMITSFTYAFYLSIPQPILFIPARVLEGFGWSFVWPTLEARAGESLKSLRIFNVMWGAGSTVAPYLGGILSQKASLAVTFSVSFSATMFSLLISVLMPRTGLKQKPTDRNSSTGNVKVITSSLFFYGFLYGFMSLMIVTFFPIYCDVRNITVENVGYALTMMNFGKVVAFLAPVHSRNIFGRIGSTIIWALVASLLPLLAIFDVAVEYLFIALFLLGFSLGFMYSLILSDIMMKAGERKGYYAGLFESILGTGFFLGPFLGGMVASLAIRYVFMMPAIFTGSFLALKALDVLRSHAH